MLTKHIRPDPDWIRLTLQLTTLSNFSDKTKQLTPLPGLDCLSIWQDWQDWLTDLSLVIIVYRTQRISHGTLESGLCSVQMARQLPVPPAQPGAACMSVVLVVLTTNLCLPAPGQLSVQLNSIYDFTML